MSSSELMDMRMLQEVIDRFMQHDITIHPVVYDDGDRYWTAYFRDIGMSPVSGCSSESPLQAIFHLLHDMLPEVAAFMLDDRQGKTDPFSGDGLLGSLPEPTYDAEFSKDSSTPLNEEELMEKLRQIGEETSDGE